MAGRVCVTGGSGFVGGAVVRALVDRGYDVNAVVHRRPLPDADGRAVRSVPGGLFDPAALDEAVRGCAAVIHLVGIINEKPLEGVTYERVHAEGTKNVVDAAVRNGVRRFVHMSALGTGPDATSRYHQTKYAAEQYVRGSGLEWTIFRPSLVHGPRGEFMGMVAKWARRRAAPFLFMPYFGAGPLGLGGAGNLQPVHVDDVAKAFVDALEKPNTVGEVYPLGGPDVLTWPELYRTASTAIVGRPRPVAAVPAWYAKTLTYVVPRPLLPFNRDQVVMSQEDNTCDLSKFRDDFGWEPRPFAESLKKYAGEL